MATFTNKKEREELLAGLRQKMAEKKKGNRRDEFEFRAPQVKPGEELNYYIRILPELSKGDKCVGGLATRNYSHPWYEAGQHWVDRRPYECPRIHDEEDCPLCQLGFELMHDTDDKEERRGIAKKYLSSTRYVVNAYFLDTEKNDESVRGKVLWIAFQKQVFDVFDACINAKDAGEKDDPRPYGLFYDVEEGYVFKLNVKRKGDYNTYEMSKFLVSSRGPIVSNDDDEIDKDAVLKILEQRHDLATKFAKRDLKSLEDIKRKLVNGTGGQSDWNDDEVDTGKSGKSGKSEKPAEEEEVIEVKKPKKAEKKLDDDVKVEKSKKAEKKLDDVKEEKKIEKVEEEDEELENLLKEIEE